MSRWVRAAASSEVPPGSGKALAIEGRWIALFHDATAGFLATADSCPHEGASLGEGTYHEGRVICPRHAWVFDVRTGSCPSVPEVRLACYATRPVGPDVEIEFPDGD